jgi:hypothetical protein
LPKLIQTVLNHLIHGALALFGDGQEHGAAIVLGPLALYQTPVYETGGQLDGTVVLQAQLFGDLLDGGLLVRRKSFDGQQQFVLLGLNPCALGRIAAATQKTRQLVAELGQSLVLGS